MYTNRVVAAAVAVLALALVAMPVQAAEAGTSIEMDVDKQGNAKTTVKNTVTFSGDAERRAFENIASNDTRKGRLGGSTAERFRGFLSRASSEVDRDMKIRNVSTTAESGDGSGEVTVSFTWTNFAQNTTGNSVTIGDVFQGGFNLEENQTLTIQGPYSRIDTNSENGTVEGQKVTWSGPTSVNEDLEVSFSSEKDSGNQDSNAGGSGNGSESQGESGSNGQPGFGPVAALIGMAVLAVYVRR